MGQMVTFSPAVRDESILEAVERQTPAVITVPMAGRWITLKTRMTRADRQNGFIALARPLPEDGMPEPSFIPGQCISLAFRRGHRKCMCVCLFAHMDETNPDEAMWIKWPEEVLAVQRRAYFRAEVPKDMEVAVRLWRGGRAKRRLVAIGKWPSVAGRLTDCSAGGMRMEIEAIDDPHIPVGEPVAVEFSPLREVGQICLDANFRYTLPLDSGKLALGLQFVGLESSAAGRQMLLVLGQVSAEYLRRGHHASGRHTDEEKLGGAPVERHNRAYEPARPAR